MTSQSIFNLICYANVPVLMIYTFYYIQANHVRSPEATKSASLPASGGFRHRGKPMHYILISHRLQDSLHKPRGN